MHETTEKSCWTVTAWALAAAMGLGVLGSVLVGANGGAEIAVVTQAAD